MRRFDWRLVVVSSVMLGALVARAETRPQYGGTLRITTRTAVASLDPADSAEPDSFEKRSVIMLMFDTLVITDQNGRIEPGLAASWQTSQGNQRWQFRIRGGVKFHDGTPLSAEIAAASLRAANPAWKVSAESDSIVVALSN